MLRRLFRLKLPEKDHVRQRPFSADLIASELLLTHRAGLQPLARVAGSSTYIVGRGALSQEAEIAWGMNRAKKLALRRLTDEARVIGADAVIGVQLIRRNYGRKQDIIELSATGTAVRGRRIRSRRGPTLTTLSAEDVWALMRAGYLPVGIVTATSVGFPKASKRSRVARSYRKGGTNREVEQFSRALMEEQHAVTDILRYQARRLRASGVVGVELRHQGAEWKEWGYRLLITVDAIGTAIVMTTANRRASLTLAVDLV